MFLKSGKSSTFTLLELLVTIAIISMLMSILLPGLKRAKEMATSTVCLGNLRQCGMAAGSYLADNENMLLNYHDDHAWSDFLLDSGYGVKNVVMCPSFKPYKYTTHYASHYYTYGMLTYYGTGNGVFYFCDFAPDYRRYLLASKVKYPSSYFFFNDSVNGSDMKQTFSYSLAGGLSSTTNGIHMRHSSHANIVFLDGHASKCGQEAIRSDVKKVNGSTTLSVYSLNMETIIL